jgi:3-deoxy-7-phosphoheptulonate synthase
MSKSGQPLLVSREAHPGVRGTLVVEVGGRDGAAKIAIGAGQPVLIAGPCAVESREQTLEVARAVAAAGAQLLRGGAWKPRTSPYSFQGLGSRGLEILAEARAATGLPIVTEALDPRHVEEVGRVADVVQIGARSMQNFPLLREVGRLGKPVLLKRGLAATLEEWVLAAEYIAAEGNLQILFCERGVRTVASGEVPQGNKPRQHLDLEMIPALRARTPFPILVDPSHAMARADLVVPAAKAALAFGVDGLMVEVMGEHTDRRTLLSDAEQAIRPSELAEIAAACAGDPHAAHAGDSYSVPV